MTQWSTTSLLLIYIIGTGIGAMVAFERDEDDLVLVATYTFLWPLVLLITLIKGVIVVVRGFSE